MFVDFDWPLIASRRLSASAELLVYPREVVSAVFATATWLAGWLAGWMSVCHSRYCIKTTKPILKLFRPCGSPII